MGLDIYAGTLTRYYSHNWKTVVQQWAEENGYTFNRITPDGEPADNEEELSPAEVQAAVEDWRDQILAANRPTLHGRRTTSGPITPTSRIGMPSALCCWWLPAIHTGNQCLPPWRRTGTSGSILWSPALHQMRSGCGPCFVGLPGGCLFPTAFCSKALCPPMIRR